MTQVSEETKALIDRMSRSELALEINKGRRSIFQDDNFAYLRTRQQELDRQAVEDGENKQDELSREANAIAREANDLSRVANRTSDKAIRISVLAAFIALLAIVVTLFSQCHNGA